MMYDKAVLDEVTSRVCAAAKEVLGGKLKKAILYGFYAGGDYNEYRESLRPDTPPVTFI